MGAEFSELVGFLLSDGLKNIYSLERARLYRDDDLAVFSSFSSFKVVILLQFYRVTSHCWITNDDNWLPGLAFMISPIWLIISKTNICPMKYQTQKLCVLATKTGVLANQKIKQNKYQI